MRGRVIIGDVMSLVMLLLQIDTVSLIPTSSQPVIITSSDRDTYQKRKCVEKRGK